MSRFWLLAIGGGAASVLIYGLAAKTPGALFLAYFAVLPLYMVGFGLGLTAGATAGATATLLLLVFGFGLAAMMFLLVTVLPVIVFIRQALLSRSDDQGQLVWYPAGLMLFILCMMGIVIFVAVAILLGLQPEGFEGAVRSYVEGVAGAVFPDQAAEIRTRFVAAVAPILPGLMTAWWLVMNLVNAAIAQNLLVRMQKNIRPSPEIVTMDLPHWFPLVVALGIAAAVGIFLQGSLAYFGANLSIILIMPFFFMGLVVVHAIVRSKSGGKLILGAFYVMLVFFGWLAIVVAALGLIEQWVGLRRRFA